MHEDSHCRGDQRSSELYSWAPLSASSPLMATWRLWALVAPAPLADTPGESDPAPDGSVRVPEDGAQLLF
jgi:hypothetical protein